MFKIPGDQIKKPSSRSKKPPSKGKKSNQYSAIWAAKRAKLRQPALSFLVGVVFVLSFNKTNVELGAALAAVAGFCINLLVTYFDKKMKRGMKASEILVTVFFTLLGFFTASAAAPLLYQTVQNVGTYGLDLATVTLSPIPTITNTNTLMIPSLEGSTSTPVAPGGTPIPASPTRERDRDPKDPSPPAAPTNSPAPQPSTTPNPPATGEPTDPPPTQPPTVPPTPGPPTSQPPTLPPTEPPQEPSGDRTYHKFGADGDCRETSFPSPANPQGWEAGPCPGG